MLIYESLQELTCLLDLDVIAVKASLFFPFLLKADQTNRRTASLVLSMKICIDLKANKLLVNNFINYTCLGSSLGWPADVQPMPIAS